jgi:predicted kinase
MTNRACHSSHVTHFPYKILYFQLDFSLKMKIFSCVSSDLRPFRGTKSLIFDSLQSISQEQVWNPLDKLSRHITILSPAESKSLGNSMQVSDAGEIKVYDLGLGSSKCSRVYYQVMGIPVLQMARGQLGLTWADFHVTLGHDGTDLHEIPKGPATLSKRSRNELDVKIILDCVKEHWKTCSLYPSLRKGLVLFSMDLVNMALESSMCVNSKAQLLLVRAFVNFQDFEYSKSLFDAQESLSLLFSPDACVQVADVAYKIKDFDCARKHYWKAHVEGTDGRTKEYTRKMLKKIWRDGHLGVADVLWSSIVDSGDQCSIQCSESRNRVRVDEQELPRFFSWVIPGVLAGMSTPKSLEDIKLLAKMGFTDVITLTQESPLPPEWFSSLEVTNHFWPVDNYYPPTAAHADKFLQLLGRVFWEKGGQVLVHCGGGKGRAGSLLATYILRFGLAVLPKPCHSCQEMAAIRWCANSNCCFGTYPVNTASQAIEILRKMRPGSIETKKQEDFIQAYASTLFARAGAGNSLYDPLETDEISLPGKLNFIGNSSNQKPSLVILVGLPASGKSWFAKKLSESGRWKVVNQDELGSREACKDLVRPGEWAIIDRVNPTPNDRRLWRELSKSKNTALIFFDISKDICIARAEFRFDHPTLPSHRASNVINSFASELIPPEKTEAEAIYRVCSFNDSIKLLEHFGVNVAIKKKFHKYPRTRHLFNVGSVSRDDLVLTPADAESFLSNVEKLSIEEKIDGANVGFRMVNGKIIAQNRSHDDISTSTHAQFANLKSWIFRHQNELESILAGGNTIFFGEWMAARHSISYDRLGDLFIAFDIYKIDSEKFLSRRQFEKILGETSIVRVPKLKLPPVLDLKHLLEMMESQSAFSSTSKLEGLIFRIDDEDWLVQKTKIVRSDFIVGTGHWSGNEMVANKVI